MEKLRGFHEYINERNGIVENTITGQDSNSINALSDRELISGDAKKMLWEFVYKTVTDALEYDSNKNQDDTLENYMAETGYLISKYISKSLNSNNLLESLLNKSIDEDKEYESKSEMKLDSESKIKELLDKVFDSVYKGFSNGIKEFKSNSSSIASLAASKMYKENGK